MIDAVGHPSSLLLLGGTSEIGLATAEKYLEGGPVRVVLAGRQSPRLADAAARLTRAGATVETVEFDARDAAVHTEAVRKAFAGGDIDVAIVAFGLLGDQEKAWQDIDVAVELAEVNYVAAVSVGVALAAEFRRQGHGHARRAVVGGRRARPSLQLRLRLDEGRAGRVLHRAHRGAARRRHRRHGRPPRLRAHEDDRGPVARAALDHPGEGRRVIVSAVSPGKEQVWAPAPLRAVMTVLRHIPRPIFRRLPV